MGMKVVDWEKVLPQEDKYCEWCGHSPEFCPCFDDLKFTDEREEE
jgi:hypothetical protein